MTPQQATQAILRARKARVPIFLWGPPGVGKTDSVRAVAADQGIGCTVVHAAQTDPVDWRGMPDTSDGHVTRWLAPSWLPTSGAGILFLDEIMRAPRSVQNACFELWLDRRIGEYRLPDDWQIVGASNRASDRAGATRMDTATASRVCHIDVEPDIEGWFDWARDHGVSGLVMAFLRFRPSLFHCFDPGCTELAQPDPRSWAQTSDVIRAGDGKLDCVTRAMVTGNVGASAAAELFAFAAVRDELPALADIVAAPDTTPVPAGLSACWATAGMLADKIDTSNSDAIGRYAVRLPVEYGIVALRDCAAVTDSILEVPQVVEFAGEHAAIIA